MVDIAVKKIRPMDRELSTVQDNLANCIQQLLDYANGAAPRTQSLFPQMQQVRGAGTATSVKTPAFWVHGRPDGSFIPNQPTIVWGDASYVTPAGVSMPQLDAELFSYGQIVAFGSKVATDGFVIIPQVAGPAFRIAPNNASNAFTVDFGGNTNIAGTLGVSGLTTMNQFLATGAARCQSDFQVNGTGLFTFNTTINGVLTVNNTTNVNTLNAAYVNGTNVNSQAGFLGNTFVASYNGTATAGYNAFLDTVSTLALQWRMPRSGSIMSIFYSATHNAASNLAAQLYKNGAFFSGAATATFAGGTTQGQIANDFLKGQLPFAKGDMIKPYTYTSAATSGLGPYHRAYIQVTVEWSA